MKPTIFSIILALVCSASSARASSQLKVSCIGPENAPHSLIYLHGMDSLQPSNQELRNRAILTDIANALNIRIALPRAFMACPTQTNSICWGWSFNQNELQSVLPLILQARTKCFSGVNDFGMIGFSNGGYLITQWYRNEMIPKMERTPSFLIASGSDTGVVPKTIQSLAMSPPLTLIIGNQDQYNRDPTSSFFNQLKALNAKVSRIEFDGGHQLDLTSSRAVLRSYLNH